MRYTEEVLWQIIDGDVTPSQLSAFFEACKRDPALKKRYEFLLRIHRRLEKTFQKPENKTRLITCPSNQPFAQQIFLQN